MSIGEGRGLVKKLITIGTPHQGTDLGMFLRTLPAGSLVSDLRKQSYLMRTLNKVSLPAGSKIVSIYSDSDWLLKSQDSCFAQGEPTQSFENYVVKNVGHIGLLFDQQVFDIVTESVLENSKLESNN
jgi:hypothetical protein